MFKTFFRFFFILSALISFSCSEISFRDEENSINVIPPGITDLRITDPDSIEFDFTGNILPISNIFSISPDIGISELDMTDSTLMVVFGSSQIPGEKYYIKGAVKDSRGNSLTFCAEFYGYNPDIPGLLINEVTTQGSSSHPDLVELYVLSEGNMAGVTFYEGCSQDYDARYVFPSIDVDSGDFIIIHAKPEGIPDEITETHDRALSGGIDSNDLALDIWPEGFDGLSGNNGVLTLYSSPGGSLIDAFLYSNRTSSSDEKYRGFGSTETMTRMDETANSGGWIFSSTLISPEDCVNPDPSTATRSICRNSSSLDTDSRSDWHTVPTSMSSFGSVNSDDIYTP